MNYLNFKNIDNKNGLTQNGINVIFQDSEGFMWFGTHYGLNRYDGVQIKTYYRGDSINDLGGMHIKSILQDSVGNIWVATTEGISVFNASTQKFFNLKNYFSEESIFGHTILSMKLIDSTIFISSDAGLWKIKALKNLITDEIASGLLVSNCIKIESEVKLESIQIFHKDINENYWLIANNQVIASNIVDNELFVIDQISIDPDPGVEIGSSFIDNFSNIWIGTAKNGLYKVSEEQGIYSVTKIYPNHSSLNSFSRIAGMAHDSEGNLWVISRGDGVVIIPQENLQSGILNPVQLNNITLGSKKIRSIFISRDATLWLGSLDNGVYYYNSAGFKFEKNGFSRNTRSINKDLYNRLWFGTLFGGLYIYNPECHCIKDSLLEKSSVFALKKMYNNKFMAGSSDGLHIITYDNENVQIKKLFDDINFSSTVFSITNKGEKYWAGTDQELIGFKINQEGNTELRESYPSKSLDNLSIINSIRIVKYDSLRNCVWIGGETSGLIKADLDSNDNIISFNPVMEPSLQNRRVSDIHIDSDGSYWVATRSGLVHFEISDNDEVISSIHYSIENGLPGNMIQSIEIDENNCLWIGTNRGLVKFNKSSNKISTYDMIDNIRDVEFNEHASFKDEKGTMYFGGLNGVTTFHPDKFEINHYVEPVHITEISVNGKRLNSIKEFTARNPLELNYNENNLSISFISCNYINPGRCRYAYMLEGYNDDWVYTSSDERVAEYHNLPKGNYVFTVKASNEDGIWSSEYRTINIEINPPFWITFQAFLLYAVLLGVFIILVSAITKKRVQKKQKAIHNQKYYEHIEKINQAKLKFFINISHEIRTPLTLIVCSVEKLVESITLSKKKEEQLASINKNISRMLHLTDELLEIRQIESANYQLSVIKDNLVGFIKNIIIAFESLTSQQELCIKFDYESEEQYLFFDPSAIEKVLYNIISNAIKYTNKGGCITIKIESAVNNKFLEISVTDNGLGIKDEHLKKIFDRFFQNQENHDLSQQGFGIGLSLSKDIMALHKGYIKATSKIGKGSVFTIGLPLNEDVYSKEERAEKVIWKNNTSSIINKLRKQLNDAENSIEIISPESINIDPAKKTILYVDDNEELLHNVSEYFSSEYNVLLAANGRTGYEMAKKNQPDVILSDIVMPEFDGFELCIKLKHNVMTSHLPVILLTARGDQESQYKGIEIGADDFVTKPFKISLLRLKIRNLIESREKIHKLFISGTEVNSSEITANSKDKEFIDNLIKYVEEHISDTDLNIELIADGLGMSRSTFFRKIKAITGTTGKEFIDSMRLKKASQLLTGSEFNISEVAYHIGHTNPQYFSKWFKAHFKMSPTQYINRNKRNVTKIEKETSDYNS